MFKHFWRKNSERLNSTIFTVFLLSFIVGSVSGAAFGVLGSVMINGAAKGELASLITPWRFQRQPTIKDNVAGATGDIVNVVRRSLPSVVSIVITKDVPIYRNLNTFPFGFDPFSDFFGAPQQPQSQGTEKQKIGGGTGFFVSADGLILTNKHVIADESADYTVILNNGKEYKATVVGRDSANDLAVLKIIGANFPTLPLGDSSNLELGQSVIAIGNALGEFGNTVSTGVVSGLSRSITASGTGIGTEQLVGVLQTDAAINPGNSGGPLLNSNGEVIGINTAVATGAQNIGFAIPINEAKQVIESVKKTGRIVRPFLGVRYVIITPELAKAQNLTVDYGALIVRGESQTDLAIVPGSPADKAGIVENDIILEISGQKITVDNPLAQAITRYGVGDKVPLKILHRGEEKNIEVTLAERK